ncbi:MAG: hypothetical protein ACE5EA_11010 [Nitrospirota bacterium]
MNYKTLIISIIAIYTFLFFPLLSQVNLYAQERKIKDRDIIFQPVSFADPQTLSLKSISSKPWYRNWRIWIIAEVIIVGAAIVIGRNRNNDAASPKQEILITSPAP